jgi:hypothetical protein
MLRSIKGAKKKGAEKEERRNLGKAGNFGKVERRNG